MGKRKLRTRDQVNRLNWKRYDRERQEIFPAMFTDMKSLKLKRIDLRREDRNNHEHNEVKEGKHYLFGYSSRWHVAKAERNYHKTGWQFYVGWGNVDLGWLEFLFEIVGDLPSYDDNPLGRVEHDFDEYGEIIREE